MERSEPTLVPEWLRSTGNIIGGSTSARHFTCSSLQSEVSSSTPSTRNRSSRGISDKDSIRSAYLGQTSSSNFVHSSSGNSIRNPYSSFTRSNRDKTRDKDKDRLGNFLDHDHSDPLEEILTSRVERTTLRRSETLFSRKPGGNNSLTGGNGVNGLKKSAFDYDFPSLINEENHRVPDVQKVSSLGLSAAVQSLSICNSGLIGGEKWTSALAEVPSVIGAASIGHSSAQQNNIPTLVSGASSAMVGLNMAEALSQPPSHTRASPQLSDRTHRLEELAIKQSRQLRPVMPMMPKPLAHNSDKSKQPMTTVRTSEMTMASKGGHQQLTSYSPHGVEIRSDAPKTSQAGKFLVLKPVRENGISTKAKDDASHGQLVGGLAAGTAHTTSPNNRELSSRERKVAPLHLDSRFLGEKRHALSQAQSRSDFFNLMRNKTAANPSAILQNSNPILLSSTMEKSDGIVDEDTSVNLSSYATESDREVASNDDTCEEAKMFSKVGQENFCINRAVYPDEEEAAFLRSLGWEENAGEDEGLTEEEINSFYQEYMKLRPSLNTTPRHPAKVLDAV